ncbi:hypothetical protein F2P81_019350 [Scophthalmus maximus]|uniref:Uncharacterized protein n=1 Tax=Scophthalmus maximus TaxID=52904 RepID=A0A6A4S1N4_SCOMX|nr:hypothetical protein F2P81_019350 [Scophthalmus maximus]
MGPPPLLRYGLRVQGGPLSYATVSERRLCHLATTLTSTVDVSRAGNCRLGATSEPESISGDDDLFRSPIIIPSLKTLRLMLVPAS